METIEGEYVGEIGDSESSPVVFDENSQMGIMMDELSRTLASELLGPPYDAEAWSRGLHHPSVHQKEPYQTSLGGILSILAIVFWIGLIIGLLVLKRILENNGL